MAKVLIGTSGWQYKDWSFDYAQDKQNYFYPPKLPISGWLEYYSQNFKTVEVNATFYHQMKPETFVKWAKVVPKNFIFSVKANRFITHVKRLLDCGDPLKRLLEQVKGLGDKLGPVLFQLPPRWKVDRERLSTFLNELRTMNSDLRVAFEFRDKSWFNDKIFKILKSQNVAVVINDSANFPKTEEIAADFTYIRFHGPSALYSSEYSDPELRIWAGKIKKWLKNKINVYAYFNNDVGGFAVGNAKTLNSMLVS